MKSVLSISNTCLLIKKYIGIFFLLAFLTACNKKVLDLKPLNTFGEESVFNDPATLGLFVNGTYLRIGNGLESNYSLTDGMTDNAFGFYSGSQQAYVHGEINRDNGEGMTRNLWSNSFAVFRRVNLFLEKAATSSIDPATLNKLKAEMQFIRAFKYAELLITYGGVPIITKTFNLDEENFDVARNSIDEVVDFIVKECDAIIPVLPNFANTEKGRATKEAAMALKARTLLYAASPLLNPDNSAAKWTAASIANKAVMDLPGFPMLENGTAAQYYNTFNGKDQSEILFARYFTPSNSQSGGDNGANAWVYPNGFDSNSGVAPTLDVLSDYEMSNGKLPGEAGSGYDPQDPYINREPRFYANFLYNGCLFYDPYSAKAVRPLEYWLDKANPTNLSLNGRESRGASFYADGASRTTHNFKKYTVEGLGSNNPGANRQVNPWIYYRMSEFYLNYAECQISLGNETEARSAINRVRQKTGLAPLTETGALLVERYRRERRVELMLENHRLADIRRWQIGPQVFSKQITTVDITRDASTLKMEYTYGRIVDNNRKWDDRMYWFPIPYSEVQRSHNKLTQNPGY